MPTAQTSHAWMLPLYSTPLFDTYRRTSMLLLLRCPIRRCQTSADSARIAIPPGSLPSSTVIEHRIFPVLSSAPNKFIGRTISSYSNLGLSWWKMVAIPFHMACVTEKNMRTHYWHQHGVKRDMPFAPTVIGNGALNSTCPKTSMCGFTSGNDGVWSFQDAVVAHQVLQPGSQ